LEFNKQNRDPAVPIASVSSKVAQMVEVQWFDIGNGTWTKIRGTFTRIANMGKIKCFNNFYEHVLYVCACGSLYVFVCVYVHACHEERKKSRIL
jgi:hypothetical protein